MQLPYETLPFYQHLLFLVLIVFQSEREKNFVSSKYKYKYKKGRLQAANIKTVKSLKPKEITVVNQQSHNINKGQNCCNMVIKPSAS